MAKDHGSSVKDDKQYEGLRKKGMSKSARGEDRQHPECLEQGWQRSSPAAVAAEARKKVSGRAAARAARSPSPPGPSSRESTRRRASTPASHAGGGR